MTFLTTNPGHVFAQCSKLPFDFTVTGCTVTFFSTDPNPPSPINWNFGDGATGTGNPITHVYLSNGTYTVTASYSGFGWTYTCTKTVTVTGCQMECCSAAFSGSVTREPSRESLPLTCWSFQR